jgi:TfoX/Sxy family transcriptional regulator of competence genes
MTDRPKMPTSDASTAARFRAALPDNPDILVRPMFGHNAAFINGNMFAGTFGQDVFVRLDEHHRLELLAAPGAMPFAPMKGRVMAEYVQLPRATDASTTASWVARALEWTATLPPKIKAKSAARGRAKKRSRR